MECPLCHTESIEATYIPKRIKEREGTWEDRPGKRTIPEKYEIQSGCSNCGKSQKEVEKALKEGKEDTGKEKRISERLKKQGLFTSEITTKF